MKIKVERAKLDTKRVGYVRDGDVGRFIIPGETSVINVALDADGEPDLNDAVLLRSHLHRRLKAALE